MILCVIFILHNKNFGASYREQRANSRSSSTAKRSWSGKFFLGGSTESVARMGLNESLRDKKISTDELLEKGDANTAGEASQDQDVIVD